MIKLILIIVLMAQDIFATAPYTSRKERKQIAKESFLEVTKFLESFLRIEDTTDIQEFNFEDFQRAVNGTQILPTFKKLKLQGVYKSAINYSQSKRIKFNTPDWEKLSFLKRVSLVLHEFLGIAQIELGHYEITNLFMDRYGYLMSSQSPRGRSHCQLNLAQFNEAGDRILTYKLANFQAQASQKLEFSFPQYNFEASISFSIDRRIIEGTIKSQGSSRTTRHPSGGSIRKTRYFFNKDYQTIKEIIYFNCQDLGDYYYVHR